MKYRGWDVFNAHDIFIGRLGEEYLEGDTLVDVFDQIDELEDGYGVEGSDG